ncbi:PIN domain-containing protein [Deinococcus sp. SL84]|uniref:PIN domain-containing protein n=1 Tax=Deinococcus sp. SL84 TaxID=2994663 RepID=UPI002275214A|nr:PIN domain-containing protein [Deinococcus sp. SL84]MCY1703779.1 PIN domain-containing protein [Deinococcus sp. SL84]
MPPRLFLDANVLYGDLLRNLLLRLAVQRVCTIHWSAEVQREWKRHLVDDAGYSEATITRTQERMEAAFPAANVSGYEALLPDLQLPDPDDRHVLAAAIKAEANILVTFNLKDFPEAALPPGLAVQHPDELLSHLLGTNPEGCHIALTKLVISLKNPPMTLLDIASALERNQMTESANRLRTLSK